MEALWRTACGAGGTHTVVCENIEELLIGGMAVSLRLRIAKAV
jgi:hypothetical protein